MQEKKRRQLNSGLMGYKVESITNKTEVKTVLFRHSAIHYSYGFVKLQDYSQIIQNPKSFDQSV